MSAEVTVSDRCEHGSFTIQVSSPGVWHLPGPGRIETSPEDVFVFHQNEDPCECWEYDEAEEAPLPEMGQPEFKQPHEPELPEMGHPEFRGPRPGRWRLLLRAFLDGGPRCSLCGVPSPHRFPHHPDCPLAPWNVGKR